MAQGLTPSPRPRGALGALWGRLRDAAGLRRLPLALTLGGLLGACAAPRDLPVDHVVTFDAEGVPVQPRRGLASWVHPFQAMDGPTYRDHVERVLARMLEEAPRGADGRRRVLVYIHGGLNHLGYSAGVATEMRDPILAEGYWPLFLQWDSSLLSCYGDHLFFVRQGEDWGLLGVPLAPFFLAGDLLRGLANLHLVGLSQARSFVYGIPGLWTGSLFGRGDDDEEPLAALAADGVPLDVWVGEDLQGGGEFALDMAARTVTYPIKLVQEPLLAGLGPGAWIQMQRRVHLLFLQDRDGGLVHLLRRLREVQAAEDLEITLVAHSMGAIVANEILRVEPQLRIDTLVYMGAACSLREYEEVLFPYLAAHPSSHLYHLTLHPKGELREAQFLDLTSRGSILVWVDGFLAQPLTPLDRVAGNFGNLAPHLRRTPADLRSRIHVKAFPTGASAPEGVPTKHAHFPRLPFWEPSFRLPPEEPEESPGHPQP